MKELKKLDMVSQIRKVRCSGNSASYTPNPTVHRHTHYEILIIKKGGGIHSIDYTQYDVKKGQVFFLRPGQVHMFQPTSDAEYQFVAIEPEMGYLLRDIKLNELDFFQSFNTHGFVLFDDLNPILDVVKELEQELLLDDQHNINRLSMVGSFLTILMVKLQRQFRKYYTEVMGGQTDDIVRRFNRLIDDMSNFDRFVKEYAEKLYVTPNYLNERVKQYTGYSASYWINEKIVLESKRLLKQTVLTSSQISKKLQFKDGTHFSRFFKSQTGLTPKQYRYEPFSGSGMA